LTNKQRIPIVTRLGFLDMNLKINFYAGKVGKVERLEKLKKLILKDIFEFFQKVQIQ
jgi:hypothetical protein